MSGKINMTNAIWTLRFPSVHPRRKSPNLPRVTGKMAKRRATMNFMIIRPAKYITVKELVSNCLKSIAS